MATTRVRWDGRLTFKTERPKPWMASVDGDRRWFGSFAAAKRHISNGGRVFFEPLAGSGGYLVARVLTPTCPPEFAARLGPVPTLTILEGT